MQLPEKITISLIDEDQEIYAIIDENTGHELFILSNLGDMPIDNILLFANQIVKTWNDRLMQYPGAKRIVPLTEILPDEEYEDD